MAYSRIIICVDDDQDDLESLLHAFKEVAPTYEVMTAHNGEEGILILEQLVQEDHIPCLVILDINMPRMDGRETFHQIRSNPSLVQIPIVIFSTSTSELDKSYFSKMNVAYFVKPIDMKQFFKVAHHFLELCSKW